MAPGIELYLPNRKTLQDLYVPSEIELPKGDPRCQVFDFPGVNPLAVAELTWVFDRAAIVWGITGVIFQNVAPAATLANGFRFQVFQAHLDPITQKAVTMAWFNKHQLSGNVAGTSQLPFLLKQPQFVDAGDAVTVEVKSLVPASGGGLNAGTVARIQVCLFCSIPDAPPIQGAAA